MCSDKSVTFLVKWNIKMSCHRQTTAASTSCGSVQENYKSHYPSGSQSMLGHVVPQPLRLEPQVAEYSYPQILSLKTFSSFTTSQKSDTSTRYPVTDTRQDATKLSSSHDNGDRPSIFWPGVLLRRRHTSLPTSAIHQPVSSQSAGVNGTGLRAPIGGRQGPVIIRSSPGK